MKMYPTHTFFHIIKKMYGSSIVFVNRNLFTIIYNRLLQFLYKKILGENRIFSDMLIKNFFYIIGPLDISWPVKSSAPLAEICFIPIANFYLYPLAFPLEVLFCDLL